MKPLSTKVETFAAFIAFVAMTGLFYLHTKSVTPGKFGMFYLALGCLFAFFLGRIGLMRLRELHRSGEIKVLIFVMAVILLPGFAITHRVSPITLIAAACVLASAFPLALFHSRHKPL
jgi:hypothetical protein